MTLCVTADSRLITKCDTRGGKRVMRKYTSREIPAHSSLGKQADPLSRDSETHAAPELSSWDG